MFARGPPCSYMEVFGSDRVLPQTAIDHRRIPLPSSVPASPSEPAASPSLPHGPLAYFLAHPNAWWKDLGHHLAHFASQVLPIAVPVVIAVLGLVAAKRRLLRLDGHVAFKMEGSGDGIGLRLWVSAGISPHAVARGRLLRVAGRTVPRLRRPRNEPRRSAHLLRGAAARGTGPSLGDRAAHVGRRRPVARPPAILASSLDTAPQGELRALFNSLQLDVVYQPADSALDVAATLYDLGSETAQTAAPRSAEDWSVHPASHNANLEPSVERPAISLAARSTRVRRAGYSA